MRGRLAAADGFGQFGLDLFAGLGRRGVAGKGGTGGECRQGQGEDGSVSAVHVSVLGVSMTVSAGVSLVDFDPVGERCIVVISSMGEL